MDQETKEFYRKVDKAWEDPADEPITEKDKFERERKKNHLSKEDDLMAKKLNSQLKKVKNSPLRVFIACFWQRAKRQKWNPLLGFLDQVDGSMVWVEELDGGIRPIPIKGIDRNRMKVWRIEPKQLSDLGMTEAATWHGRGNDAVVKLLE